MRFIKQLPYLLLFLSFFVFAPKANATCEAPAKLKVSIQDPSGKFIPNATYQIYTQTQDVYGDFRPNAIVASGVINPTLGFSEIDFLDDTGTYVIKVWDPFASAHNDLSFWFYGETISCGETKVITKKLSGIEITLRDTEDELKANHAFEIYKQEKDADGEPIKGLLVGSFITPTSGEKTIYVPSKDNTIDGEPIKYLFESTNATDGIFKLEDITTSGAITTKIDYTFSDIRIHITDTNGVPLPATNIEFFKQELGEDDEKILGTRIGSALTNDDGIAIFEYPAGKYVARIMYADGRFETFWNVEIYDRQRRTKELVAHETENVGAGICSTASEFNVVLRNLSGDLLPGLFYTLYEQTVDDDGKDVAGNITSSGVADVSGEAKMLFRPNPRKKYALKIYEKNALVGDYWFFNVAQFTCGQDREITKYLPKLKVILRDGAGELKKNQIFSLHTQKTDIDGNPIKEIQDLVSASFSTGEIGQTDAYIAPDHTNIKNKLGTYAFTSTGKNGALFEEYGIKINWGKDSLFEYIFSDVFINLKNAKNEIIPNKRVELYEQSRNEEGKYTLGKLLVGANTNENGQLSLEYKPGTYALVTLDSINQQNKFWDVKIKSNQRNYANTKINLININVLEGNGKLKRENTIVAIHKMIKGDDGAYYEDIPISSVRIGTSGYYELSLAPGAYLFKHTVDNLAFYGKAVYVENGEEYNVTINMNSSDAISDGQKFILKAKEPKVNSTRLSGYILLQVENNGEAWYVNPADSRRYYMQNGAMAYQMMRKFGLGITNVNLQKIPIGLDDRFDEVDSDFDGLHDKLEEAIGTDPEKSDTDEDGYADGHEIQNGYSPLGSGKLPLDNDLAEKLKGKIVLQVESRGEAWYINPKDGRRYYMKNGDSAYEIMRFLSLGITDNDLGEIDEGELD